MSRGSQVQKQICKNRERWKGETYNVRDRHRRHNFGQSDRQPTIHPPPPLLSHRLLEDVIEAVVRLRVTGRARRLKFRSEEIDRCIRHERAERKVESVLSQRGRIGGRQQQRRWERDIRTHDRRKSLQRRQRRLQRRASRRSRALQYRNDGSRQS
jgi:hypothetical protein